MGDKSKRFAVRAEGVGAAALTCFGIALSILTVPPWIGWAFLGAGVLLGGVAVRTVVRGQHTKPPVPGIDVPGKYETIATDPSGTSKDIERRTYERIKEVQAQPAGAKVDAQTWEHFANQAIRHELGPLLADGIDAQDLVQVTCGSVERFKEALWDWEQKLEETVERVLGRGELGSLKAFDRTRLQRPTPDEFDSDTDAWSWHHADAYIDWLRKRLDEAEGH